MFVIVFVSHSTSVHCTRQVISAWHTGRSKAPLFSPTAAYVTTVNLGSSTSRHTNRMSLSDERYSQFTAQRNKDTAYVVRTTIM